VQRKRDFSFTQNDYSDVTKIEPKSKRCTNPLMPTYTIVGNEQVGTVEGSTSMQFGSAPLKNYNNDIMRTSDIGGAQASTKGLGIFTNVKRREDIKCSLNNADVIGAQVSSLKKGPVTNRRTNPLLMDYKYPGAESLIDKHDPFSFKKEPTIFAANASKVLETSASAVVAVPDLKAASNHDVASVKASEKAASKEASVAGSAKPASERLETSSHQILKGNHFMAATSPDMQRSAMASSHGGAVDQKSYLNEQRLHEHVSIIEKANLL